LLLELVDDVDGIDKVRELDVPWILLLGWTARNPLQRRGQLRATRRFRLLLVDSLFTIGLNPGGQDEPLHSTKKRWIES